MEGEVNTPIAPWLMPTRTAPQLNGTPSWIKSKCIIVSIWEKQWRKIIALNVQTIWQQWSNWKTCQVLLNRFKWHWDWHCCVRRSTDAMPASGFKVEHWNTYDHQLSLWIWVMCIQHFPSTKILFNAFNTRRCWFSRKSAITNYGVVI